MAESQQCGVKRLRGGGGLEGAGGRLQPARHAAGTTTAVHGIANHGVSDVCQVNADLVGSTGRQTHTNQITDLEARARLDHRLCGAASGENGHALAVLWVPSHGGIDLAPLGEMSPDQGGVDAFDVPPCDGAGQSAMRPVGLGHNDQSRGVLVQPMDQAGTTALRLGERCVSRHERVE